MTRTRPTFEALRLVGRSAPWHLAGSWAISAASGLAPVAAALLTKTLLDAVSAHAAWSVLLPPLLGLAGVAVVLGAAGPVGTYLEAELGRRAGRLAKQDLFAAVQGLQGIARFEDPRFQSRLRLAESAGGNSPGSIVRGSLGLARAALTTAGMVGALLVVSPLLTAAVVVAAVPALLAELRLNRRRMQAEWQTEPIERREFFYTSLLSDVQAAKEIRLFGLGTFFADRMLTERRRADAMRRAVDHRDLVLQGGLSVMTAAVAALGLVWAVARAAEGSVSVGEVSLVVAAIAGLQSALAGAVTALGVLHHATSVFRYHLEVLATDDGGRSAAAPAIETLEPLRSAIVLDDVWFRYTEDSPWVLRGVSLTIPAGSSVGLVGRNGAGKSTLVKLLCRFYEPTRGRILWDGVDLAQVRPDVLRERLGAVFQDFMSYELSATENIAVGDRDLLVRPHAGEEVRAAAERAGIAADLERLPRGYDTLLSRVFFDDSAGSEDDAAQPEVHGSYLSGGQWQKLATARALMRADRDLMILDEPSSGLDPAAERDLHQCLARARHGRTNLLVSHRLGALRDADLLVTLVDGRVGESGTHDALLALDGLYAELFRAQASGYQMAAEAS
ncbi:ABC transporter ATP-binding protein [Luteipulveratus flavus]|uniref:ABC transporter ATP-binding protein n=1 Tax=Luteipulveratus flavus TaxID=3031728 RepID=A0ABT6C4R4_9MICO|nr:ABC transporter ATP-binding protein [Luteipulveratus sp. YIM 133296]MDF8263944.1 ABC transporter ATP-binding protein [Luteipulveratus sp. YIM 133296]